MSIITERSDYLFFDLVCLVRAQRSAILVIINSLRKLTKAFSVSEETIHGMTKVLTMK